MVRFAIALTLLVPLTGCLGGGGGSSPNEQSVSSAADAATTATQSNAGTQPNPSAGTSSPTVQALGEVKTGEGTFYGATGAGNCSYDATPQDLMVAAMNHTDYAASAMCGAFVEVTGPKGTVTVRITDRCPECRPGDVDLSEQAFARIADLAAGRVQIRWKLVAGDVQGPVNYRYKDGSHQYWQAIQVLNHRVPVTKLEILPNGSTAWITLNRADYNYFIHPVTVPNATMQVRVTALGGATVQNMLPAPQGGLSVTGTAQFP